MGSRGYREDVPQLRMPKAAASCWRRAAEVETQVAQITDEHLKAVYSRIARQWSGLARSYEFADSAKRFLLDAKWTKDANARQPERELVLLPSSLPSGESQALPAARSGHAGRAARTPSRFQRRPAVRG
jgi:hypothetical protein